MCIVCLCMHRYGSIGTHTNDLCEHTSISCVLCIQNNTQRVTKWWRVCKDMSKHGRLSIIIAIYRLILVLHTHKYTLLHHIHCKRRNRIWLCARYEYGCMSMSMSVYLFTSIYMCSRVRVVYNDRRSHHIHKTHTHRNNRKVMPLI